jgi:hypothetical protein
MATQKMDQVKVARVIKDAAVALRTVSQERDALQTENAKLAQANRVLTTRMQAEKVAMDMHDKGVHTAMPFADLVDTLEKRAHQDPKGFEVLKEAVNLTGPDMMKTASVGTTAAAHLGASDFEQYILGDIG